MCNYTKIALVSFAAALLLVPAVASAQDNGTDEGYGASERTGENLPPPRSSDDPPPPVAQVVPPGGVVAQAGIGGQTAYGRAGVLELGGSAGFLAASGFQSLSVNPSVGWFLADNLQMSAIMGVSYVSTAESSATLFSLLVEPSYHVPFSQRTFGFLGLGMGGSSAKDVGFGFAIAPRLGANILIGRSGILTPSLSYQYTTHEVTEMRQDTPLAAISTALMANIGYTVMW